MNEFCIHETCIFAVVYCKVHSCSGFTAKFVYNSTCFYSLWDFCGSSMSFHDSWLHSFLSKVLDTTNDVGFSFKSKPVYEQNYWVLLLEFEFYMKSVWDFFVKMLQAYIRVNVSIKLSIVSHT